MTLPALPFRCRCGSASGHLLGRRAALALAVGGAGALAQPAAARAQALPRTPESALHRLLRGNGRYATGNIESLDRDTAILRRGTLGQQKVFAAVLACTDLAEPVDLIFDQTIGSVRTAKTPGNVVTKDAVARLEYAATGLGATALLVLGHSGCATIAAAIKAHPPLDTPGPYAALARAVFEGRGDPVFTAQLNALAQASILTQRSRPIAGLVAAGRLAVVAAYFDARTRRVITSS